MGAAEIFCPDDATVVACADWAVVKTHSYTATFTSSMKKAVLFGFVLLAENFSLVPYDRVKLLASRHTLGQDKISTGDPPLTE